MGTCFNVSADLLSLEQPMWRQAASFVFLQLAASMTRDTARHVGFDPASHLRARPSDSIASYI